MRNLKRLVPGAALMLLLLACGDSSTGPGNGGGGGGGGQVPPPAVLLKDIVIPNLPAPYYHFDYDSTGRVSGVSFASGFTMYGVVYQGDRISRLQNNTLGNQDRLEYSYDGDGRVTGINYVHPNDEVFTRLTLSYAGTELTGLERQRLMAGVFVEDKTMAFSYSADGNLEEITEHRPAIAGFQPETTTLDRFEQYDDGLNVDGFGLLHQEFFDHLVLLPGVQLQKGNPGRVTHTGDGTNYRVDTVYQYDDQGRPRSAIGDLVMLNGPDVGRHFQTDSEFSYY
jgi:hypothetical protein